MPRHSLTSLLVSLALLAVSCAPPGPSAQKGCECDRAPLVTFVVIGDTHTIGTPKTGKGVYARIIEQVNEIEPDLLVHVGDMIVAPSYMAPVMKKGASATYSTDQEPGISTVDTFMAYTRRLSPSIDFYPVLGNHEADFEGFEFAIEAFPQFQGRGWYSFDRDGVHFFIVENNSDTADSTDHGYRSCRPNGGLNTPGSGQRRWLNDDLRLRPPGTLWTFGFGHRAYYGAEGRAFRPNIADARAGENSFCGIIENDGVDVFFNGDMHCYTRTVPMRAGRVAPSGERGTTYVTCGGAGGRIRRGKAFPDTSGFPLGAYRAGTHSRHFFVLCEVYDDLFRAQAVDTSGVVFDQWEIRKGE